MIKFKIQKILGTMSIAFIISCFTNGLAIASGNEVSAPINPSSTDQIQESSSVVNKVNTPIISNVWARSSIASNPNSAAYLNFQNNSDNEIKIIAASAPSIANNVELHNSFVDENGISRMVTLSKVAIPARSNIEFKPGGLHIMLFDLKRQLKKGEKFDLSLMIENGEPINLECEIK